MATIVTRAGKGSPLTNNEIDANFTGINSETEGKIDGPEPDGGLVGVTETQTLTNKTLTDLAIDGRVTEEVFAVTGTTPALSPTDGTIQTWVLSANSTPTFAAGFTAGSSLTLMIDDGAARTITWPATTWVGGSAPTLALTGYTVVELWRVGSVYYGALVGAVA